jgi:hypothetical protein
MDNSFDQQKTKPRPKMRFSGNLPKIIENLINWISSPFLLTEEEKEQAGIYIGRIGEDD